MKLRSLPFWLVCDLVCWLGVLFTFPAFAKALHRVAMASTAEGRGIRCSELSLLARLLAEAEGWIAFAIQRRAFSLAGLKPSQVRFEHPTQATTIRALLRRARQLMRANQAMDARARGTAQRLRRLSAAATIPQQRNTGIAKAFASTEAAAIATPRPRARSAPRPTLITAAVTTTATRTRAGMRVRAPPWRARLPIANCLLPRKRQLPRPLTFGHSVYPEPRRERAFMPAARQHPAAPAQHLKCQL